MVGFSEFNFLSGTNETDTLNITTTGGDTVNFTVVITNKEPTSMTYRLGFVDAGVTNDTFAQRTCLSTNENQNVGQYITGDISPFTLTAGSSGTKNLSVTFPNTHNGPYTGCITISPVTVDGNTDVNTLATRGIFLEALVYGDIFTVNVKAFPSNRVYQATNNMNTGILKIYDSNKTLIFTSPLFTLNDAGTGETDISVPVGTYYVAFKGQSHLASYLSGVTIGGTGSDVFDFTTGSNLYGAQNLDSQTDNGNKYQTAGDLKNINGDYDFVINGNDISVILYSSFPQLGVDVLEPRNLNGDSAVNASDISIIGANSSMQDAFATAGGIFIW
ncbi:MAG: hypothetical protein WC010_02880 [Candidatus Absconditabacterales bacterium]